MKPYGTVARGGRAAHGYVDPKEPNQKNWSSVIFGAALTAAVGAAFYVGDTLLALQVWRIKRQLRRQR